MQRPLRIHFASHFCQGWQKCSTTPTWESKSAKMLQTTPWRASARTNICLHRWAGINWPPTAGSLRCRQIGRGITLDFAPKRPWNLSCYTEDITHHHYLPGRNSKHNFGRPSIARTHSYAMIRKHSLWRAHSVIIGHFRQRPWETDCSTRAEQEIREAKRWITPLIILSRTSAMVAKMKWVVWWYGYTSRDNSLEPCKNNLQHFINSSWNMVKKRESAVHKGQNLS